MGCGVVDGGFGGVNVGCVGLVGRGVGNDGFGGGIVGGVGGDGWRCFIGGGVWFVIVVFVGQDGEMVGGVVGGGGWCAFSTIIVEGAEAVGRVKGGGCLGVVGGGIVGGGGGYDSGGSNGVGVVRGVCVIGETIQRGFLRRVNHFRWSIDVHSAIEFAGGGLGVEGRWLAIDVKCGVGGQSGFGVVLGLDGDRHVGVVFVLFGDRVWMVRGT